jgi:hypothetical protein
VAWCAFKFYEVATEFSTCNYEGKLDSKLYGTPNIFECIGTLIF